MGAVIVLGIVFLVGFFCGWGMKSDIRTGVHQQDQVVRELQRQRADNYLNNPVVNEIKRHH